MLEDFNNLSIDVNYELQEKNKKKKASKKIVLPIIIIVVTIIIFIFLLNGIKNLKPHKNLVFLVQDVSNSLQNFYNNDNLLMEQYLDYNSLMNFIDRHSYFNRTDIYACLSGTQPEKSYDLLGILKETELLNQIDKETYDSILDYQYYQIKYSRYFDPDYEIKNSLKDYNLKLDNFLKQIDVKQKTVLAYYFQKDTLLCKQVSDDLVIQNEKDKCTFWWFNCYKYVFPKELLEKKLREDKISIFLKKNINFEEHKEYKKYYLSSIYNIIQKTKSNILKQYDNIKVSDILSIFKDKDFGKSYLVDTLTKVKNELIKNTHENKILLLITDGKTTDGSILNIIEERKSKTNTYIVVFFISSHDWNRPKELFISPPSNLYDYERDLFEASSSLNSNIEFFFYLRKKGITVQNEGQTKLFFQANDDSLIKILFQSLQNLFNNHDVLFDRKD